MILFIKSTKTNVEDKDTKQINKSAITRWREVSNTEQLQKGILPKLTNQFRLGKYKNKKHAIKKLNNVST